MKKKMTTLLRNLLKEEGPIIMPSVGDCLSLRIIERAGFKVVLHGGFSTAAILLGMPDVGLITMSESVGFARNMAACVKIPVICDVDEGFGSINNVIRTTREVIRSGLAGMLIEDQVFPKRCPGIGGGNVVSCKEMLVKLRAVMKVRKEEDPDFVIIARTYSSRVIGMDEAVKRGKAYAEAGADIIFVDLGYSDVVIEELKQISKGIGGYAHLIANMTETVGRPMLTDKELFKMGFKIIFYPMTAIMTTAAALKTIFTELKEKGTTKALVDKMMPFKELEEVLGVNTIRAQEEEFSVK